jgi:acyl carrier protein
MNVNNAGLDTESQVIKVLSEYFSMDRLNIQRGSRLVEDLYMDSMNLVETVMVLNEAFETELPAAEVAQWRTVADIIGLVQSTSSA